MGYKLPFSWHKIMLWDWECQKIRSLPINEFYFVFPTLNHKKL